MPEPAFPNESQQPVEEDIKSAIGTAFPVLEKTFEFMRSNYPGVTIEWKFGKKSGWYLFTVYKKRRIFYLIPQMDNFKLTVLLGDKAALQVLKADYSPGIKDKVQCAPKFGEGRPVTFDRDDFGDDSDDDSDLEALLGILRIKVG